MWMFPRRLIILVEFLCGARSELSGQALRMGGAVLRIRIAVGTTQIPAPPNLQMKRAVAWRVDLDNKVELSRLYCFCCWKRHLAQ